MTLGEVVLRVTAKLTRLVPVFCSTMLTSLMLRAGGLTVVTTVVVLFVVFGSGSDRTTRTWFVITPRDVGVTRIVTMAAEAAVRSPRSQRTTPPLAGEQAPAEETAELNCTPAGRK